MMKFKVFLIFLSLLLYFKLVNARQQEPKALSERIMIIAKALEISERKAAELVAALDYNQDKIKSAMQNQQLKVLDRQQLISRLLIQKRIKIESLLTDEQYVKLKELFKINMEKAQSYREKLNLKQAEEAQKPVHGAVLKKLDIKSN